MAIRQKDESLLVYHVIPALEEMEHYLELQQEIDAMRFGGQEDEDVLLLKVKLALDDLILRIHLEGQSNWKVVENRIEGALERCAHHVTDQEIKGKFIDGKWTAMRRDRVCRRCKAVIASVTLVEEGATA